MIGTLEKIDTLDFDAKTSVEVQALAHKLAKEKILRLLSDLGAYTVKSGDTFDKTYA